MNAAIPLRSTVLRVTGVSRSGHAVEVAGRVDWVTRPRLAHVKVPIGGRASVVRGRLVGLAANRLEDGEQVVAPAYAGGPSTTLRAVWNEATSAEVAVRKRAWIDLKTLSGRRFEVNVFQRRAWRKRALIQRFDQRLGRWRPAKSVVLTDDDGYKASASFTVSLAKGTRIRAVFPRSQTGPCYETGTSRTLTT